MVGDETAFLPDRVAEYEALLCKLSGVCQAKFVLDHENCPVELHVLAGKSRSPKQLVRDIQSAMLAGFGLEISHRIISVAQADLPETLERAETRIVCREVSSSASQNRFSVRVTLSNGEQEYVGEASDSALDYSKRFLVARATAMAVEQCLGQKGILSVADVSLTSIANRQAVMVAVAFLNQDRQEMLLGAVFDQMDLNTSIVKATLDAVNRRVSLLQ